MTVENHTNKSWENMINRENSKYSFYVKKVWLDGTISARLYGVLHKRFGGADIFLDSKRSRQICTRKSKLKLH